MAGSIHDVLRETFGFPSFRPHQQEIVEHILVGQDVVAVMPTGGGKSLCYQLPAVVLPGTAVVVSPLISLMKDQVDGARAAGIRAAGLNSSLGPGEAAEIYRALHRGELDLLYLAPERLAVPGFLDTLAGLRISLFAIDEAHCISQWGHDFRPDYRALCELRAAFPAVPIAAFTASATGKVQEDVIGCLDLRNPLVVRASFDRPNLFYEVRRRTDTDRQVLEFLGERKGSAGIVYCATRREVDRLAAALRRRGVGALPYHAGLETGERQANQEAFDLDQAEVIVATIAFGMGIDKQNVRFVVHANLPKDMESYYQETGRAGRDGEPAHCLLLYSPADIPLLRRFHQDLEDEELRRAAAARLQEMVRFAGGLACRRRQVLRYFGEEYGADNCGSCDVCLGARESVDISEDARKVLSAVYRTGQRFGAVHVVDVVTGADTQKIRQFRHDALKTYGVGREHPKTWWRAVVDELIGQECLRQGGESGLSLSITPAGMAVLRGERTLAAARHILERRAPQKAAAGLTGAGGGRTPCRSAPLRAPQAAAPRPGRPARGAPLRHRLGPHPAGGLRPPAGRRGRAAPGVRHRGEEAAGPGPRAAARRAGAPGGAGAVGGRAARRRPPRRAPGAVSRPPRCAPAGAAAPAGPGTPPSRTAATGASRRPTGSAPAAWRPSAPRR